MSEVEEFAHGSYGDYSGVVFFGSPPDGFGLDRLAVSDIYTGPLFGAIIDRVWRDNGGEQVPQVVSEWTTLTGWAACGQGRVPITPQDAVELIAALGRVTIADVAPHCAGCAPEECIRCASVIRSYISTRLASGVGIYIEMD